MGSGRAGSGRGGTEGARFGRFGVARLLLAFWLVLVRGAVLVTGILVLGMGVLRSVRALSGPVNVPPCPLQAMFAERITS